MSVPALRFTEFEGEWEESPLSNAWRVKGKRNSNNEYGKNHVLSVSGEKGIVNQIQHLGRSYAGVFVDNYHIVETGDIVYTKSPLKANPYGIIKANKGPNGIVSTLYAVYEMKECHDHSFWDRYFESIDRTNHYLMPLVHIGAKNDMKINNERVLIDPVSFPTLPEQKKIAAFLGVVDDKLAALKAKRDLLSDYKRGVMQKLFSQELRFTKPNGQPFPDWEEKRLGDQLNLHQERVPAITSIPIYSSSRNGLKPQKDYFADRELANEGEYGVVPQGFITYRHMSDDLTFKFNINNLKQPIAVSKEYPVFSTTDIVPGFLVPWLNNSSKFARFAAMQKKGGTRTRLYFKDLSNWKIPLPHPDEQKLIADALSALDAKIDAVAGQVAQMEAFKKGLLQQMFV